MRCQWVYTSAVPELTDRIWADKLQAWEKQGTIPLFWGTFQGNEEILGKRTEGYTGRSWCSLGHSERDRKGLTPQFINDNPSREVTPGRTLTTST